MTVVLGAGWITPGRDFDVAEHLELKGLRPLARASRLACVAAAAALRYPDPLPAAPERCAIVLGTRFASIEPLVEFNRVALTDGPGLVNPSSFPNVVVNAHAGYLGILFGLAGPNVTLCGETAGLDALGHALDLLELGRADAVLAGGVEAYGETLFEGLRRAGADEPEEAAAFLLLSQSGSGLGFDRSEVAADGVGGAAGALAVVQELERELRQVAAAATAPAQHA
jgi:3-oxoacyl-(acyl-carrier-protein) synthase